MGEYVYVFFEAELDPRVVEYPHFTAQSVIFISILLVVVALLSW
jgi:hypothetical protein